MVFAAQFGEKVASRNAGVAGPHILQGLFQCLDCRRSLGVAGVESLPEVECIGGGKRRSAVCDLLADEMMEGL